VVEWWGGRSGVDVIMGVNSRRTVGTLFQDLRSLVFEQLGVTFECERHRPGGCFRGRDRIRLELGLGQGVRLSGICRSGRAGDVVEVGRRADFDQADHGVGGHRGGRTGVQIIILGIALDDRRGRRRIEVGGMDGVDEECEEE